MIQSLLTQAEYDELSKFYKTYNPSKRKSEKSEVIIIEGKEVRSGPPPNYTMGNLLTPKEIKWINKQLNEVLATVRIRYNEKGEQIIHDIRENLDLKDYN